MPGREEFSGEEAFPWIKEMMVGRVLPSERTTASAIELTANGAIGPDGAVETTAGVGDNRGLARCWQLSYLKVRPPNEVHWTSYCWLNEVGSAMQPSDQRVKDEPKTARPRTRKKLRWMNDKIPVSPLHQARQKTPRHWSERRAHYLSRYEIREDKP